jgi:hypothetical protein
LSNAFGSLKAASTSAKRRRNFSMCGVKSIFAKKNPPASDDAPAGGIKAGS